MAFTQEMLDQQAREIDRLSEDLNRLNALFAQQKSALNIPADEPVKVDRNEISREALEQFESAKARIEGQARADAERLKPAGAKPAAGRRPSRRSMLSI